MSSPPSDSIASVNECIPPAPFSLYYAAIYLAIALIKIMPINHSDWPLFRVKSQSKFYFAVRLTFGCRSSPHHFNLLSKALCWIMLNVCRLPFVFHLLDDFLLIDFPSNQTSVLDTLREYSGKLGSPYLKGPMTWKSHFVRFFNIYMSSPSLPMVPQWLKLACSVKRCKTSVKRALAVLLAFEKKTEAQARWFGMSLFMSS